MPAAVLGGRRLRVSTSRKPVNRKVQKLARAEQAASGCRYTEALARVLRREHGKAEDTMETREKLDPPSGLPTPAQQVKQAQRRRRIAEAVEAQRTAKAREMGTDEERAALAAQVLECLPMLKADLGGAQGMVPWSITLPLPIGSVVSGSLRNHPDGITLEVNSWDRGARTPHLFLNLCAVGTLPLPGAMGALPMPRGRLDDADGLNLAAFRSVTQILRVLAGLEEEAPSAPDVGVEAALFEMLKRGDALQPMSHLGLHLIDGVVLSTTHVVWINQITAYVNGAVVDGVEFLRVGGQSIPVGPNGVVDPPAHVPVGALVSCTPGRQSARIDGYEINSYKAQQVWEQALLHAAMRLGPYEQQRRAETEAKTAR